ncbi:hypothetical protein [Peribacillus glennii]|uniref:Uncharacterized protein n=1 Tax=Peribacillus glennii TaxID=2303991 RepID=A0A372LGL2_9BACI|nr:hypothetical protein [Peribacillus glennii]RFU65219.1 hypothetical protein D0466_04760 [Peribacillus glennii]
MKLQRFAIAFIIISLFVFPVKALAGTEYLEKYDNPISFMVEVLPWHKTNQILPKGSVFTIIDVETGLQFKGQRRAGSRHADVQPLTKKDTRLMKKIYNGRWSWKRRPILIRVKDQMIAASMHGMPHGAGALKNGFPGHFCIHFFGSTTHGSRKMDVIHHLMILKAGGKMDEYLDTLGPFELINVFSIAVNLDDLDILKQTVDGINKESELKKALEEISYFEVTGLSTIDVKERDQPVLLEIPVNAVLIKKNNEKEKTIIHFIIRRNSLIDGWYIDGANLMKELSHIER